MTASTLPTIPVSAEGQSVVLHGISWSLYELLLRKLEDQNIRLTYDDGELEIMSPLPKHEFVKTLLGRMIETLTLELNIPASGFGSTTFKRKRLKKGLEPDECYYIQNEAASRRMREKVDLRKDPPPDLVVEVDVTHRSIDREPLYAALRVPELWRFDGAALTCLHLGPDGNYAPREMSLAFPFLRVAELQRFLEMTGSDQTTVLRAFRDWVNQTFQKSPVSPTSQ